MPSMHRARLPEMPQAYAEAAADAVALTALQAQPRLNSNAYAAASLAAFRAPAHTETKRLGASTKSVRQRVRQRARE